MSIRPNAMLGEGGSVGLDVDAAHGALHIRVNDQDRTTIFRKCQAGDTLDCGVLSMVFLIRKKRKKKKGEKKEK
jgi:hypothetical protein